MKPLRLLILALAIATAANAASGANDVAARTVAGNRDCVSARVTDNCSDGITDPVSDNASDGIASPEQPDTETPGDTLDEIVVVAERIRAAQTAPSLQIDKIYLDRLEGEQRRAVKDLSGLVPNLFIPDYGARMTSTIYVRGLGARIDNPVLGIAIDGVAIANKNNYDFEFDDIAKVEILRGPQGTLFGKNTIGGVVNIQTLTPRIFEGLRGSVSYGNGNTGSIRAGYYRMLSPRIGLAATVSGRHSRGLYVNTYDNSPADASNEASARIRLDYSHDRLSFSNTLNYSYVDQTGFPYHEAGAPICHNDPSGYRRHGLVEGFNLTYSLPGVTINSITSYQMLIDRMAQDQDFLPLSYFNMQQIQHEHYAGEELTFRSADSPERLWSWIAGISAGYKHNSLTAPVNFLSDGIRELILDNANAGIHQAFPDDELRFSEDHFTVDSRFRLQNADLALFHTSYFRLKSGWLFELGIRLNYEHLSMHYQSDATVNYLFTATMHDYRPYTTALKGVVRQDYFEVMPRVAVSYQRAQWSVYASAQEGYKGGGFNTQLFSDILRNAMMNGLMADLGVYFDNSDALPVDRVISYKPEKCMNFELGAKYHQNIGDWRLRADAALFWIEIVNQQLTVFPTGATGRMMTNAGRSRSFGAEAGLNAAWRDLSLSLNYGYANARFVRYNDGHDDYRGKRLPYVPAHTLAASLTYRLNLRHSFFYGLTFNVNTSAYGPILWNEANTLRQPFYALLNANIALDTKYFSIELWGKNITSTAYNSFYFVSSGHQFYQSGRPATYGIKVNFFIQKQK